MKKIRHANGMVEFQYTTKEKIKLCIFPALMILFGFGITATVLSAIQPKQMIYEGKELQMNKVSQEYIEVRNEFLEAKRDLAKEKLEIAIEKEDWPEVERLKQVIISVDGEIKTQDFFKHYNPVEKDFLTPPL